MIDKVKSEISTKLLTSHYQVKIKICRDIQDLFLNELFVDAHLDGGGVQPHCCIQTSIFHFTNSNFQSP